MPDVFPIPSPGVPLAFGEQGKPLVVLLHDWYGRLPWLENYATALARVGFRVVVPDLYKGWGTTSPVEAATLSADRIDEESFAIIDGILADETHERVATVGWSMGGWVALAHAQSGAIDAAVTYYPSLRGELAGIIPAPLQFHFAEIDDLDPASLLAELKESGTPVDERTYLGTEHGFANASMPDRFVEREAALAFARTASFLEKHLVD